ncbi:hypothetical protein GCM10020229_21300 [Kitasatospora albolonga]
MSRAVGGEPPQADLRWCTPTSPTSAPWSGSSPDVDACFFCLGVTSAGKRRYEYRRITHDYTLAAARALPVRPDAPLTFVYVSGDGTDSNRAGSADVGR